MAKRKSSTSQESLGQDPLTKARIGRDVVDMAASWMSKWARGVYFPSCELPLPQTERIAETPLGSFSLSVHEDGIIACGFVPCIDNSLPSKMREELRRESYFDFSVVIGNGSDKNICELAGEISLTLLRHYGSVDKAFDACIRWVETSDKKGAKMARKIAREIGH